MRAHYLIPLLLLGLLGQPANASADPPNTPKTSPAKPGQPAQDALSKQRESLEKQRQAIRQQLGEKADTASNPVAEFIDPMPAQVEADCGALEARDINALVAAAAKKQSLEPALLRAVIKQESAFKPCAVSPKGAQGLMQLMPATAQELHVKDIFDPEQNVQAGAAYLKQLLNRYKGDLRLALVGYNAGPVRAGLPTGTPYPLETQNYIARIFAELGMSQTDASTPEESADPAADNQPSEDGQIPVATAATEPPEKPAKP